jgi:hypothetical protein
MSHASRGIEGLRPSDAASGVRALTVALIAPAVCAAALLAPRADQVARSAATVATSAARRVSGADTGRIVVVVRPPAYSHLEERTLTDPQRLDVLEGSRLAFSRSGTGSNRVRFGERSLGVLTGGGTAIEYAARDNGYFAIESPNGHDRAFVVLSVTPDRLPSVRVENPARDLLLPDALRTVPVTIAASDDLGLESVELRYTKISGAGEQFQFSEGRIPIRVERATARDWRANAGIALASLQLEAGDSIVYRAVATDRRPGATGLGTSDTFFIEIAGPGHVPLDAVGMPPNEDRYALSQQMIVLKIERLRARERALTGERTLEEAALIAAEQRSVRANFIFLLGGHIEDEEVEAEQSSEIAEGRLLNPARRDINSAIRGMTRAEQGLAAVDTAAALAAARSAVSSLQRAFGRSRYFLRTLPARGRVDPSRRLTGKLDAVSGWNRNPAEHGAREGDRARELLAAILDLSTAARARSVPDPEAVARLAERALSVDPSSTTWQEVSRRLLRARARLNDPVDAQSMLDEISTIVRREADRGLLPRTSLSAPASPLLRAWEGRGQR